LTTRLGRKFGIRNVNTVGMEHPISDVLGFTKLYLRQFSRMAPTFSFDLNRTLADFGFTPVFTEHILHKSSNIASHESLPAEVLAVHPPIFNSTY